MPPPPCPGVLYAGTSWRGKTEEGGLKKEFVGKDKRRLKEDESQLLRQGDITFMSREARRRKAAASYNRSDYAMLPRSAEG